MQSTSDQKKTVYLVVKDEIQYIFSNESDIVATIDGHHSFVKGFNSKEELALYSSKIPSPPPPKTTKTTHENHENPVSVWIDGCCEDSNTSKAVAGIGIFWGENNPRNVSELLIGTHSKNSAEIHAAIKAIILAKTYGIPKLVIHSNSSFLIDSATRWMRNWASNGWKTQAGKQVVQKAQFKLLRKELASGIIVYWCLGTSDKINFENNEVDKLSRAAVDKYKSIVIFKPVKAATDISIFKPVKAATGKASCRKSVHSVA